MTIYSILLAWNSNDKEQGLYSACIDASTEDGAIAAARQEMQVNDQLDGNPEDIEDSAPAAYEVVDIYEGANMWAADLMLAALKETREEIARVNTNAGRVVFNPAITANLCAAMKRGMYCG